MAWPNPFRRRTENTRYCWGYQFEWTPDHLTREQAEPLKHSYDVLAEECLDRLNAISPPPRASHPRNNSNSQAYTIPGPDAEKKQVLPHPQRDLFTLLQKHHAADPKLSQLWTQINTVPSWVDWAQIERGQDVFYRYGGPALTGLTFQSLLGGMGAARVVETLSRTGGFSPQVARRRLFETTQHILQCTRSLESIQPGGAGHASTVRVRLLHASVRQRIVKLAKQRPEYFNLDEWGIPVNDLDQIATISTFSATLIWLSLPRQGIYLSAHETTDYIALWRYIGYLIGTPDTPFSSPKKAKAIMESLLHNEVNPSHMSSLLAGNIITALENSPPTYVTANMLRASARWLNGGELYSALKLPPVPLYYSALMAGQCLFFMAMCYLYRSVPALDRAHIARAKKLFYKIIVESEYGLNGTETLFEFKFVPEYDTVTEVGGAGVKGTSGVRVKGMSVEMRNLRTLGVFLGLVGLGGWAVVRVGGSLVRKMGGG